MVERFQTDVLIIGAGVAGMAAALEAHRAGAEVELAWAGGGASTLAQGGMAAAVGKDDCPAAHAADTLAAGAGLSQPEVVNSIVSKGAGAVQWLSAQGVEWDREANGSLALAMEAAHSRPRVAHAGGDRSGHAITQALR
ncbi:MAG: FAD-dependent oxidoreductase, partial [Candidatus Dormibacteraceae bacterium]